MPDFKSIESSAAKTPMYMKYVLLAAGIYNLCWGAAVILFPTLAFDLAGMELPRYTAIWQCVGMIVGVYGIGYLIASRDPFRHWPIVLVGLAGKILGPFGFLFAALRGELPLTWGTLVLMNDVIWWLPFAAILFEAFKYNSNTSVGNSLDVDDATMIFPSNQGRSLTELSNERPLMIVFLRHFGCTFCKEALQDLSRSREQIESLGISIALVHMSHPRHASATVKKYGLEELDRFCDDNCEIYRAFGVERGSLFQLFGPKVICRGFAAIIKGNTFGALAGDGFRMPGIFFMYQGEIHGSFRHQNAADRPDYAALAKRFRNCLDDNVECISA